MYNKVGLSVSQMHKEKLKHAYQNKTGITLKLNASQLNRSGFLGLTKTQLSKIKKAKTGITLKLSRLQVSKQGGFIGTLLAGLAGSLLPALLGGKGLVLPGSKGKGLILPGTKGKGLSKRKFYYFEKPVLGQGLILRLIHHIKTF